MKKYLIKQLIFFVLFGVLFSGCSYSALSGPVPVVSPIANIKSSNNLIRTQRLIFRTETMGAVIKYTKNGTTPSWTNGIVYNGNPIEVTKNETFKVIALVDEINTKSSCDISTFSFSFRKDVLFVSANVG